jgi:ATP-binding cassette subfamily G (WHITE) protein 2 (SNQ2)
LFAEFDQLLLLKGGGKVRVFGRAGWVLIEQTVYFGAVSDMGSYFNDNGVPIPQDTNPAEFMIDVVSGHKSKGRDWARIWLESSQRQDRMFELDELAKSKPEISSNQDDVYEFASSFSDQIKIVCERAFVQVSL